jgi:uncharacterized protein YecE (DUF72 family)
MTEIYLGTSGWSYKWNKKCSLDWYVRESGFNAIELNMSYYRFPYPNMVKSWARKGKDLAWVIKVHRSITHYRKLNRDSYPLFRKFKKSFEPMEECIHYFLFQLPPGFADLDTVSAFVDNFESEKLAIEFRERSMFSEEMKQWGKENHVLLVSVDAPELPDTIMSESVVYERIHGTDDWYDHDYSDEELKEIKDRVLSGEPKKVYLFFNNDHSMLKNGRAMYDLLKDSIKREAKKNTSIKNRS